MGAITPFRTPSKSSGRNANLFWKLLQKLLGFCFPIAIKAVAITGGVLGCVKKLIFGGNNLALGS